eukprot:gene12908-biopygen4677
MSETVADPQAPHAGPAGDGTAPTLAIAKGYCLPPALLTAVLFTACAFACAPAEAPVGVALFGLHLSSHWLWLALTFRCLNFTSGYIVRMNPGGHSILGRCGVWKIAMTGWGAPTPIRGHAQPQAMQVPGMLNAGDRAQVGHSACRGRSHTPTECKLTRDNRANCPNPRARPLDWLSYDA